MDGVVRGGDTVAGKEILGEGFASLQLRGGGGGAEDAQALGAEAVDDAGDQGPFRADDGERHAFVAREREQAVDVGGGDVGVAAFAFGRGAGVAGGDEHFIDARRLRQLPRPCVFASAGADDEEFHARISRNRLHQCRKVRQRAVLGTSVSVFVALVVRRFIKKYKLIFQIINIFNIYFFY